MLPARPIYLAPVADPGVTANSVNTVAVTRAALGEANGRLRKGAAFYDKVRASYGGKKAGGAGGWPQK